MDYYFGFFFSFKKRKKGMSREKFFFSYIEQLPESQILTGGQYLQTTFIYNSLKMKQFSSV